MSVSSVPTHFLHSHQLPKLFRPRFFATLLQGPKAIGPRLAGASSSALASAPAAASGAAAPFSTLESIGGQFTGKEFLANAVAEISQQIARAQNDAAQAHREEQQVLKHEFIRAEAARVAAAQLQREELTRAEAARVAAAQLQREELVRFATSVKNDMSDLKAEFKKETSDIKAEFKKETSDIKAEFRRPQLQTVFAMITVLAAIGGLITLLKDFMSVTSAAVAAPTAVQFAAAAPVASAPVASAQLPAAPVALAQPIGVTPPS